MTEADGDQCEGRCVCQGCANVVGWHEEIAAWEEDKGLLDWLDLHGEGYGNGWICRLSEDGRGWRLHETSRDGAFKTVREAIRDAKERQERGDG